MAKKRFALGVPVVILVLGFVLIGCPAKGDDGSPTDGSWTSGRDKIVLSGSNWTWYENNEPVQRGTITISGGNSGTFTWTLKQVFVGGAWRDQTYATGTGNWTTDDFLAVTGSYQVTADQLTIGSVGTFFK